MQYSVDHHINVLRTNQDMLRKHFPVDMIVPAHRLDMDSRRADSKRQFKHAHQMCVLAVGEFKMASVMRTLLMIDSYLALHDARCGLGLHGVARSMIELHGLTRRVLAELSGIRGGERSDWKSRGEGFFRYVTRARYGTRDPELINELTANRIPKKALEPIHSKECIEALNLNEDFAGSGKVYDVLCDYAHANSRGYFEGSSGFTVKRVVSVRGSVLVVPKETVVTRYEYPAAGKFEKAVELTAGPMNIHSTGLLAAADELPESPYAESEVLEHTGTKEGLRKNPLDQGVPSHPSRSQPGVGRNDPCPCGSGKKYKRCCLGETR